VKRIRRLILLVAALGLAAAMAAHWAVRIDSYGSFRQPVFVEIPLGTPTLEIGEMLAEAGVLRHPWLFALARLTNPRAKPQAGEYEFSKAATPAEVFRRIARGDVYLLEVAIPEGADAFDVAAIIARHGFGGETEALRLTLPSEGALFPAVYRFKRRSTAAQVVEAMRRRGDQAWRELGAPDANRRETTILASLVEKETAVPSERPLIAGVYANRLAKGMRLECDPTVAYAARLAGRWRGTIYKSDLAADHPYNTYQRAGLPPGPIANPGMESLRAALKPAETPALFFVAKPDGSGAHVFSESLDAHAQAVAQYRKGAKADAVEKAKPGGKSARVAPKPTAKPNRRSARS
jgi:UPF0755 protein